MAPIKESPNSSDGEAIINGPLALGNIVSVQVFLRVVPANCVQAVLNLENHRREGADRWLPTAPRVRF